MAVHLPPAAPRVLEQQERQVGRVEAEGLSVPGRHRRSVKCKGVGKRQRCVCGDKVVQCGVR